MSWPKCTRAFIDISFHYVFYHVFYYKKRVLYVILEYKTFVCFESPSPECGGVDPTPYHGVLVWSETFK